MHLYDKYKGTDTNSLSIYHKRKFAINKNSRVTTKKYFSQYKTKNNFMCMERNAWVILVRLQFRITIHSKSTQFLSYFKFICEQNNCFLGDFVFIACWLLCQPQYYQITICLYILRKNNFKILNKIILLQSVLYLVNFSRAILRSLETIFAKLKRYFGH